MADRRASAAGAPGPTAWTMLAVVCAATSIVLGAQAPTPRLAVAAASDLQGVLPDIARSFERRTGTKVALSFGASGTLFAQIQNGAPFDVFMSADIDYPRQLAAAGLGDPATLYAYATGRLALWVRRDRGIDPGPGLPVLADPRVRHVAIANPQRAPYGRAAVAALRTLHVYQAVEGKLVLGDNISQTAQLVESGNADAGILSMSTVLNPAMQAQGRYVEIPAGSYPPIEQAAILVRATPHAALGRDFIDHLRRDDTRAVLARSGLTPPDGR